MDPNQIKQILQEHYPVSNEMAVQLAGISRYRNLSSGEALWQNGDKQELLYLLESGLLYAYFITEQGKSACKEVYWGYDLLFSFRSLIQHTPQAFNVDALETTRLIAFSKKQYLALVAAHEQWKAFHLAVVCEYYMYKEGKEEFLLLKTPEQRVKSFYQLYPELVNRIPQNIIASYLGITPISFSRIKKRVKNQSDN